MHTKVLQVADNLIFFCTCGNKVALPLSSGVFLCCSLEKLPKEQLRGRINIWYMSKYYRVPPFMVIESLLHWPPPLRVLHPKDFWAVAHQYMTIIYISLYIHTHTPDHTRMITMLGYLLYQDGSHLSDRGSWSHILPMFISLHVSYYPSALCTLSPALYPANITSGTTVARLSSKRNSCFDSVLIIHHTHWLQTI